MRGYGLRHPIFTPAAGRPTADFFNGIGPKLTFDQYAADVRIEPTRVIQAVSQFGQVDLTTTAKNDPRQTFGVSAQTGEFRRTRLSWHHRQTNFAIIQRLTTSDG
jgi:hypothetical protein